MIGRVKREVPSSALAAAGEPSSAAKIVGGHGPLARRGEGWCRPQWSQATEQSEGNEEWMLGRTPDSPNYKRAHGPR